MSTQADGVVVHNIVWPDITTVDRVNTLAWGGADIYLSDEEGDEINLELNEEATIALRDELMALYPVEAEEKAAEEAREAEAAYNKTWGPDHANR